MQRWSCTMVVLSGSSRRPPSRGGRRHQPGVVHEIALGAVGQQEAAGAERLHPVGHADRRGEPAEEQRRRASARRHSSAPSRRSAASSRAKCSTALLMTTSNARRRSDDCSTGSTRKWSAGSAGASARRQGAHGVDRQRIAIGGVHVEALAQQVDEIAAGAAAGVEHAHARARCVRAATGRTGRCRCGRTVSRSAAVASSASLHARHGRREAAHLGDERVRRVRRTTSRRGR